MSLSGPSELRPLVVLRAGVKYLADADNMCAQRDAEIMLSHVLGIDTAHLPLKSGIVTAQQHALFQQMLERRVTGEPVAYITGKQSFWTLDLHVNASTLIPRPDTETLVEVGLSALMDNKAARILDIGTGSGCVLLSLLSEIENSCGVGIDLSGQALEVATLNAMDARLGPRTQFFAGDLFAPLHVHGGEPFDLIVSNPPYIPSRDIDSLMVDVRNYEPLSALDGGADGYVFYKRIANESMPFLKDGGAIAVEVGFDQAEGVAALFEAAGFKDILTKRDLNGISRVVSAKK